MQLPLKNSAAPNISITEAPIKSIGESNVNSAAMAVSPKRAAPKINICLPIPLKFILTIASNEFAKIVKPTDTAINDAANNKMPIAITGLNNFAINHIIPTIANNPNAP